MNEQLFHEVLMPVEGRKKLGMVLFHYLHVLILKNKE